MGLFGKKDNDEQRLKKAKERWEKGAKSLEGVAVEAILDEPTFTDSTWEGKTTIFRVIRLVREFNPPRLDKTHEVIVVRGKGTKEYEARLEVADRKVIKSFVINFYG